MADASRTGDWAQRLTWAALALSIGGVAAALIAAVGSGAGVWPFGLGFGILRYAFYASVAGGVLAIVAFLLSRRSGVRMAGLNIVAFVVALLFAVYLIGQVTTARSVPAIHDASTDLTDVPQFSALTVRADNLEKIPDQDRPELAALDPENRWKALHREAYGDLRTLRLPTGVADTVRRVEALARTRGWDIAKVDAQAGIVEATATTRFFRFKDDVVVRVRPDPARAGASVPLGCADRERAGDVEEARAAVPRTRRRSGARGRVDRRHALDQPGRGQRRRRQRRAHPRLSRRPARGLRAHRVGGWTIGVIGGSGLYAIDALEEPRWTPVETPWGPPSDDLLTGRIGHVNFVFLPRHGRGHRLPPSDVNARANVGALKRAGCTDIVAICAVGSLREGLAPGRFVIVDQFIDRTVARPGSFFGPGMVAHVSMADPTCARLSAFCADAGVAAGASVTRGGTYLAMEGPQFSSRAESALYRQWGCDVIGMTAMPEAKLAREAELPYALVGMVTDYDCWREAEQAVEVSAVIAQLMANAEIGRRLVVELAQALPRDRVPSPIDTVLDAALITAPNARDPAMLARLDAICARVLRGQA